MAEPDPEIQRQINELNEAYAKILPGLVQNLQMMQTVINNGAKGTADSLKNLTKTTRQQTEAEKAYAAAEEAREKAKNNYKQAVNSSKDALKNFATGLTNTSTEFSKFNGAISSAGDAALAIGKNFGLLGFAIGAVIKGVTAVAEAATKQADNALKATDQMNKMGAAGAHSAKEVAMMATQIGLSNEQWNKLPKALQKAGDGIVGLGGTVAEGQRNFAGMLAVTNEQREAFQRLGISQEELMERQADFVALQKASGVQLTGELKTREGLRKASLEYTSNLLELAAITGKDVDQAAAMQKQAQAAYEIQLDNARITRELKKAEQEGNTARIEQLKQEQSARNKMLDVVADIGDADMTAGLQQFLATGAITEQSAMYKQLGLDMEGYRDRIKRGEDVSAEFAQALKDGIARKQEEVGAAAAYNKEVGKIFGITEKTMSWAASRADVDEKKARAEAAAGVGKPGEGKTGAKAAEDPAQKARNAMTTATIEVNKALEKTLMELNPLMSGFNKTTIATTALAAAAGVAALALGAMAAKKTAGAVMGKLPSLGGGGKGIPAGTGDAVEALGKGGGNILEGAAKGLQAFANPKVVIGAAGLGAAITAIGAGIAGATWILGKALPSLAEGLEPFTKLDGDKLVSTGKGVAALGGGLAVFSAGGVAASFGSIATSLVDGLGTFFGAKTPFDKIQEFSKLDINAEKVKSNSEAFMAFGKAMASAGGGTAAAGFGTVVGAIGEGVSSFFKSKPPTQQLIEFSKLDIDAEKTKKNADSFVVFSEAMSKYKGGTGESVSGAIAETASKFFGADPPFKKFIDFSKLDIADPDIVKRNASAFVSFSDAMAKSQLAGGAASGLSNLVGGIADSIGKLVGNKSAVENFVEFSKLNIDPDKTGKLAEAFKKYAEAMGTTTIASTPPKPAPAAPSTTSAPAAPSASPASAAQKPASAAPGSQVTTTPGGAAVVSPSMGRKPPSEMPGTREMIDKLKQSGIVDPKAHANILAQIKAESGGVAKSESLKYTPERLLKMFPKYIKDLEDAKQLVAQGEEAIGNRIYGGRMGNLGDEGYKYRGRGLIQLTGKSNYEKFGKIIGVDLVKEPDLANDPDIAQRIAAAYFKEKGKGKDLTDIKQVGKAVGYVDINGQETAKREKYAQQFLDELPKAAYGGFVEGPEEGFPVALHGQEAVVPLKPDSILAMLGKSTAEELKNLTTTAQNVNTTSSTSTGVDPVILMDLMDLISNKLDSVIGVLETGNDTSEKILQYSQV